MPLYFASELRPVVIAKRQVRSLVRRAQVLLESREVKGKHVARQEVLRHELVEYGRRVLGREGRVSQPDDRLEVVAGEHITLLIEHLAKGEVLQVKLAR